MERLRQIIRIPAVLVLLILGAIWILSALAWDRLRGRHWLQGRARQAQAAWCRLLCALFGVRVELTGEQLADGPVLVAANHISWLDIPCLAANWPLQFLSKSEVRHWPLVGVVATRLDTVYLQRGARDGAERAIKDMANRLRQGRQVVFFPEGTTSDGNGVLPFRPRLFQAAIEAGVPVQPLTFSYHGVDGEPSLEAPFIDDTPLLQHVIRLAAVPGIVARLHLGAPIGSVNMGRTALSRACYQSVAGQLGQREQAPVEAAG